jgi:hypothetical protein
VTDIEAVERVTLAGFYHTFPPVVRAACAARGVDLVSMA